MDNYHKLTTINDNKQKSIDEIRITCASIDKAEEAIREKIVSRKNELIALQKEFTSIIETYNQIIKSSHR